MTHVRIEREFAGRPLVLETGKWAKQADGSVVASFGGTTVLCTAQSADAREGIDFFPLTVDYREKTYAAGKFPGGFFKREARPTTKEILTCRLIDRPVRPLFPDGYKNEVQIMATVLTFDGENDPDIIAMIAAFAALNLSSIPFEGMLGACRVGHVDGEFVINPTKRQLEKSTLNLTMAAKKDSVVMVEAGAREVPESLMLEALEEGQKACAEVIRMIQELVKKAGKAKQDFAPPESDEGLRAKVAKAVGDRLAEALTSPGSKHERGERVDALKEDVVALFEEEFAEEDSDSLRKKLKEVKNCFSEMKKEAERKAILAGTRVDGRGYKDIRDISIEVGMLPRLHGSAVFTRGETQALVALTLGTVDDQQIIDGLEEEYRKRFLLHYNFPPFSVGECRPIRGPGRREIGHGALAERALEVVLPDPEIFPYTIRLVSEILESNGSSSMATVCGGTLAMMDAGVPIAQPVAGIAMGLIKEGRKTAILSDILGSEDHCGDMDFKVTGTQRGITALQMDIKCSGLTRALMEKALEQAKEGRVHILKEMLQAIRRPRQRISEFAPRLERLKINPEKIGIVIGPGGKHIRALQEETKTRVNVDDDGTVLVSGVDSAGVEEAVHRIQAMTAEVEIGRIYKGRVVSVKEFGAFIEVLPGQEGFCHVSELDDDFVRSVADVCAPGDELEVRVDSVDELGRIRLTRKRLHGDPLEEDVEGRERLSRGGERRDRRHGSRDSRGTRPHRDRGADRGGRSREARSSRDREEAPRRERGRSSARDGGERTEERPRSSSRLHRGGRSDSSRRSRDGGRDRPERSREDSSGRGRRDREDGDSREPREDRDSRERGGDRGSREGRGRPRTRRSGSSGHRHHERD